MQLKNLQHGFDTEVNGIAITIRLGAKWQRSIGELIDLWECDYPHAGVCTYNLARCHQRGTAMVIGWWYGRLADVPESLISLEHEESCRTTDGLTVALVRAYGEDVIMNEDSPMVTALVYLRLTNGE